MVPFGSATHIVNTQLEIFKKQKTLRQYKMKSNEPTWMFLMQ
jgi:hypothetical protein